MNPSRLDFSNTYLIGGGGGESSMKSTHPSEKDMANTRISPKQMKLVVNVIESPYMLQFYLGGNSQWSSDFMGLAMSACMYVDSISIMRDTILIMGDSTSVNVILL